MEQTDITSMQRLVTENVFVIREATLNELPILIDQRRNMYLDMGYTDTDRLDSLEQAFAQWAQDRIADGHYRNWIIESHDGLIVAGAGLWLIEYPPQMMDFEPYRAYIMNVYTDPEFRGRGLAKQLIQTLLNWCHENGIHTVSLHASEAGRPVYEALGFCSTNELRIQI
jgi:GNAT superfamily N-acetyltransferase